MDYNYEENIAKINQEFNPDIKTVYLRAEKDSISSSMIRELIMYNKNISQYVPEHISKIIETEGDVNGKKT